MKQTLIILLNCLISIQLSAQVSEQSQEAEVSGMVLASLQKTQTRLEWLSKEHQILDGIRGAKIEASNSFNGKNVLHFRLHFQNGAKYESTQEGIDGSISSSSERLVLEPNGILFYIIISNQNQKLERTDSWELELSGVKLHVVLLLKTYERDDDLESAVRAIVDKMVLELSSGKSPRQIRKPTL
jgi:hypothetical protein